MEKRKVWKDIIDEHNERRENFIASGHSGPIAFRMVFMYLDESYVNKNHCMGQTWYHEDDEYGAAGNIPSGKGERLVMLTAITEEFGMIGEKAPSTKREHWHNPPLGIDGDDRLLTLLLFQARKSSGDYHLNMNADCFCEWLVEKLWPQCQRYGIKPILVMDNASYHCTPAQDSINVSSFTSKGQCIEHLDRHNVPYRVGRAPNGDNLSQLKVILSDWLKAPSATVCMTNAEANGLKVNVTRVEDLCEQWGWPMPIMTPPYHPELQPIERLWRDVKMYVARQFVGGRKVSELTVEVMEGFLKYGTTKETSAGRMAEAFEWERKYNEHCRYDFVDLTNDDGDDTNNEEHGVAIDSEDDDSDDDEDFYGP